MIEEGKTTRLASDPRRAQRAGATRTTRFKQRLWRMFYWTLRPRPEDHPEQQALELEAHADALRLGPAFAAEHADELGRLVMTYADDDAHKMLSEIREHFWSGEWERIARGRRR